ncbi:replication protein [Vibrio parahaemolyticus]|nr:replication protein [Vibrio parahaemolyticus]
MKCLLAMSVLIDFYTKDIDASITDFEKITGLSRPMVIKGISRLQNLGIIEVDKTNYRNNYKFVVKADDSRWAKVPLNITRKKLSQISNRGTAPFVALKVYITLLSLRRNEEVNIKLTHEKIREYTRVQPNQIRAGLDVLFSYSLLHLLPKEENMSNEYQILGI